MKRNAKKIAAITAAVGGLGFVFSDAHVAKATILTGPVVTIYSDSFTGTGGTAISGNAPTGDSGVDGGTPGTTWAGIATPAVSGAPDAVWNYSGSSSASITSPPANIATTGTTIGEDTNTIVNIALPIVPIIGYTYDLEATFNVPAASGGHGLEMAFLYNNGNGHISAAQAISNNDPVGLYLDRDAINGTGYNDIFENTGTGSDNSFAPSSGGLTGGSVGSTVTVDSLFTPTGATTATMSWYLNGLLVNTNPVSVTGLTGGVGWLQIGDNRITGGTITNFSLTAVPEPTVIGLMLSTVAPLLLRRNRKPATR